MEWIKELEVETVAEAELNRPLSRDELIACHPTWKGFCEGLKDYSDTELKEAIGLHCIEIESLEWYPCPAGQELDEHQVEAAREQAKYAGLLWLEIGAMEAEQARRDNVDGGFIEIEQEGTLHCFSCGHKWSLEKPIYCPRCGNNDRSAKLDGIMAHSEGRCDCKDDGQDVDDSHYWAWAAIEESEGRTPTPEAFWEAVKKATAAN